MPTVFDYEDYRAFLAEHARNMRHTNPRWSYGVWARRLGLKTTSSITKIVQGQRGIGEELTEKLVAYFDFDPTAASHFRDLVRLHRFKKDPRLCGILMQRVPRPRRTRLLGPKTFDRIFDWYFLALREMVRLDRFLEDPHWIARQLRFPIGRGDVRPAIRQLIKLGLLTRDRQGRLKIVDTNVVTACDLPQGAIRAYHKQVLHLASMALETVDVLEREFGSETFLLRKKDLPAIKTFLRDRKDDVLRQFEAEDGDAVYQYQFQLFPLTR